MSSRVTIVVVGEMTQAVALRAVLESMAHEVRLLRITTPDRLAPAFMRASEDDVVIFSAHAGPKGVRFDAGDTWLPMVAAFEGVTFRDDAVLLSTACATRESGLVQVILNAGGHLIAPLGYPDDKIIVPWVAACLLQAEAGLAEAVTAANALVSSENHFSYG